MTRSIPFCVCMTAAMVALQVRSAGADPASFTRLVPAKATVVAAATAFPGGGYNAENILKPPAPNGHRAEYASHGKGAKTFIDFDLGRPERVAAFRHIQRRTPDTIAEANLLFSDAADFQTLLATVKIQHVDEPGATTFAAFAPVTARYVRWQVTSVLPGRSPNVGGQGIEFFAAGPTETRPEGIGIQARTVQVVERQNGGLVQPLKVILDYPYAETAKAVVAVAGQEPRPLELTFGSHTLPYTIAAADAERTLDVAIEVGGQRVAARAVPLPPTRKLTVYMLPHSHTDIGYTAIQTDIEEKQINNLLQGLADARRTADYPEGARFVWNVEVLWAADLFLNRLSPQQQDEFCDAVKRGQLALNGMYLNELTGLCRPEELVRLFRYATQLGERTGVPVDSAMISDVPGYTWGTVTAMAQAGIKYFSVAPNYFDRIGDILVQWENKPFWWIGPDGQSKVLVWIPFWGYAMSHRYGQMSAQLVEDFSDGLEKRGYPYDIACVRWAGHGDNAVPDPIICEFVKEWNATHDSPRFVISSTSEAFRAFEKRYGDQLPQVRGDWTPYWEDGAGSSAAETAMNRASSERLAQAETLWALLDPTELSGEAVRGGVEQRAAVLRAHLGGALQHLAAGDPVHVRPVEHQAVVRDRRQPAITAAVERRGPAGSRFSAGPAGAARIGREGLSCRRLQYHVVAANRGRLAPAGSVRCRQLRDRRSRPACARTTARQPGTGPAGPGPAAVGRPALYDREGRPARARQPAPRPPARP